MATHCRSNDQAVYEITHCKLNCAECMHVVGHDNIMRTSKSSFEKTFKQTMHDL